MDDNQVIENTEENHDHDHESEQKKSNVALWGGIALIAILLLGGVALSQSSKKTSNADLTAQNETATEVETTEETSEIVEEFPEDSAVVEETQEESVAGDETSADVKVIEVEGGSFYYKPNEIRVKKGETVKIVLNSVDMMHDFVIDELNVRTEIIKAGNTGEVEFTANKVGEFEFYCSVGSHRANGMVGTLIVE